MNVAKSLILSGTMNKGAEQFSKNASLSYHFIFGDQNDYTYIHSVNQLFENSSN